MKIGEAGAVSVDFENRAVTTAAGFGCAVERGAGHNQTGAGISAVG